ncbi:hypothetical protein BCV71DRAFT_167443, partial [Rhizopus microsporus]
LPSKHIHQWHDHSSVGPLTYLGFPLFSITAQHDVYLNHLVQTIRNSCDAHANRSLSVRGRATALNTLILSRLWHVLRVTAVLTRFFTQTKSVMPSFLCHRIFPKI